MLPPIAVPDSFSALLKAHAVSLAAGVFERATATAHMASLRPEQQTRTVDQIARLMRVDEGMSPTNTR
jgi:hypothetical protein